MLGEKLRGFGQGRMVVPGGKVDPGEAPRRAAARELFEETSLRVNDADLDARGVVTFAFPDGGGVDMRVHVFVTDAAAGEPKDSDELLVTWVPVDALPTSRMWPDNVHWLPAALAGGFDEATFTYAADGATLASHTGI
nr:8-oxo-dGTP diphosphatase [Dermacoccus sp. Tok2021]